MLLTEQNRTKARCIDLVLHVTVTELETDEVLERFTQQLVEVEERVLVPVAQQPRDRLVDAVDGLLRDPTLSVARRLKGADQFKKRMSRVINSTSRKNMHMYITCVEWWRNRLLMTYLA